MSQSKQTVAILGFGPTAVFAARAAHDAGCDVMIFSTTDVLRTPPGAFWLHWVPPIFQDEFERHKITITGTGNAEAYSQLQWGGIFASSFPSDTVVEEGYNPEIMRQLLPNEVRFKLMDKFLTEDEIDMVADSFDFTFQTFPCKQHFKEQPPLIPFVAAAQFSSMIGKRNEVWYNGTGMGIIVREATLFGNHYLEFPKNYGITAVKQEHNMSLDGYHLIKLQDLSPLSTPVEHPNPKVTLVGRMAQWSRKVLSHDAYALVKDRIENGR